MPLSNRLIACGGTPNLNAIFEILLDDEEVKKRSIGQMNNARVGHSVCSVGPQLLFISGSNELIIDLDDDNLEDQVGKQCESFDLATNDQC